MCSFMRIGIKGKQCVYRQDRRTDKVISVYPTYFVAGEYNNFVGGGGL